MIVPASASAGGREGELSGWRECGGGGGADMQARCSALFAAAALAAVSAFVAKTSSAAAEAFTFSNDFSSYAAASDGSPTWFSHSILWKMKDGRYVCEDKRRSFSEPAAAPVSGRQVVEATVTLRRKVTEDWKVAGVAVTADAANYWHLALVEAPHSAGARHFVELFPDGIRGEVLGQGQIVARRAFRFDNPAVQAGKPALVSGGFASEFSEVRVEAEQQEQKQEQKAFPPYAGATWQAVRSRPSGFFRVEQIEGRWWLIDPDGRGFFALGTDHANYNVHWCEKLGYAPYSRNVAQKYGSEEAWAAETARRLKSWGFNCVAANHSPSLRHRGLAHMEILGLGQGFAGVSDIAPQVHWTGFPNVFHPEFAAYCEKQARLRCEEFKGDPWFIGYMIDNELEWYGKSRAEWGLFDDAFKKPREHAAKQALVDFLRTRRRNIASFNRAWGTAFLGFDEMLDATEPPPADKPAARKDMMEFVRLTAERYFAVTTQAIRKYDPDHLILGCRFAGRPPGIWDIAGRYCDVVTVNCYRWADLERGVIVDFERDLREWYAKAKRPLMITEWSFPALDSGLPCRHGAGQRFDTQEQRAKAFTIFQSLLLRLPFMVGSDFFMWVDEPALGISSTFPEDSNYGLVNEKDEPYQILTRAAAKLHAAAHELHAERGADISVRFARKRGEANILNRGPAAAEVLTSFWVDGKRIQKTIRLRGGESRAIILAQAFRPGGHFVHVEAEPAAPVPELKPADNSASRAFYVRGVGWPRLQGARWAAALPIVVANDSEESVDWAPIAASLPKSLRDGKLPKPDFCLLLDAQSGSRVPFQIDELEEGPPFGRSLWEGVALPNGKAEPLRVSPRLRRATPSAAEGPEIAFAAHDLKPRSARTYILYISQTPLKKPKEEAVVFSRRGAGFDVRNGRLHLANEKGGPDIFDQISLDGTSLGRFRPLVWQQTGRDFWVAPQLVERFEARPGPVRLILHVVSALPKQAEEEAAPRLGESARQERMWATGRPFRACYRFAVWRGQPWFSTRFMWLENADAEPWLFRSYFHFVLPHLGGSEEGDEPGGPSVPSYYIPFATWRDATVGACVGITAIEGGKFQIRFWIDEKGRHADCQRAVEKRLAPGERYARAQPEAFVFGAVRGDPDPAARRLAMQFQKWRNITARCFAEIHAGIDKNRLAGRL
jgi:hypothetical protein